MPASPPILIPLAPADMPGDLSVRHAVRMGGWLASGWTVAEALDKALA